jgi:hypothetical protein
LSSNFTNAIEGRFVRKLTIGAALLFLNTGLDEVKLNEEQAETKQAPDESDR